MPSPLPHLLLLLVLLVGLGLGLSSPSATTALPKRFDNQKRSSSNCGPDACYQGCSGLRPKLDLVFLLDVSLSMSPKIRGLLAGLEDFALELDETTDALFAAVHFGRASFPHQHHFNWFTLANPFLLVDHPPELKQQLTTAPHFKHSLEGLFTFGTKETGLEAISTSLRIAKKGNLNIHYRTGPNTKKVFILVTNEDSDAAIHPENRFSTKVHQHTYTQKDSIFDGHCKGSTIDANTWQYAWQKEIDFVAAELADIDASLYLFVAGRKSLESGDVRATQTCNTPFQYCNPDLQVQSQDYSSFNPAATLSALVSQGQQHSLQGQLLAQGFTPRCFDVADTYDEETLNQFFAQILEETSSCDPCLQYSCSPTTHQCLAPVNICGCDNVPGSNRTQDANGVCCLPSDRDCAGLCFGASTYDHPCGVCSTPDSPRFPACLVDCAGRDYLALPPNPTSLPAYARLSYETVCPEVADLLLVNDDILNEVYLVQGTRDSVCAYYHTFGRFEGRSSCTFDADLYAATYPEVSPAAARDDWLASLLTPTPRSASCVPETLARFPPFLSDQCGQCVTLSEVPPYCLQDCSGVFRRQDEPAAFVDNCGFCVPAGSDPNARKDACGICGGNNATLDPCGVCGGPLGNDGCGQPICSALPCEVDCDGVPRNPSTKTVDECGNCVLISEGRDPACQQDCASVWYNDKEGFPPSLNILDECGNCVPREQIRLPSCVQDCAGTWAGTATLDDCQQCILSGGVAPYPCEPDCRGVYYRVGLDPLLYQIDDCAVCANEAEFNQDLDPCGFCVTTDGYNSTLECTLDCKGEYHLIDDPERAFVDACGDCFFGNQTDMYDQNPDRCYAYCQPEVNGYASWSEVIAGSVATGVCLPGYYSPSITRDCLNEDSLGVWAPLTSSCDPVYCAADILPDGTAFSQTLSSSIAQGICPAGSFGSVTRNCTDVSQAQGVWENPIGVCQACPAGTYQSLSGQLTCTSCPPNSNSPTGSTSASSCTCLPGFSLESGACQALYCPAATFANASFLTTLAGNSATGTCSEGFTGHPVVQCLITGIWSEESLASPCEQFYNPSCANPLFCGSMAQATCNNCYRSGGVVDPAFPTVCYCPATTQYSQVTGPFDLCTPPLTLCPGSYLCDPACLTCGGPAANQCTSCTDPSLQLVLTPGETTTGSCLTPCLPSQYRDASGVCQDPNCGPLANCNGQGTCRFNGTQSVCDCNANFRGQDCSIPVSCPTLANCSNNGVCTLNPVTQALFCECNFGWTAANCSQAVTWSFSPNQSNELGGATVVIFSSVGFTNTDVVTCTFGTTVVQASVQEPTAYCISPPSHEARISVTLSVVVNGNVKALGSFAYTLSNGLAYSQVQLTAMLFTVGVPKTVSYTSTTLNGAGATVTASLFRWSYDMFDYFDPDPVLQDLGVIATAPNNGSITLTLSLPPYDYTQSLYILSLTSGAVTNRRYILPRDASYNSTTQCQNFVDYALDPPYEYDPCRPYTSAGVSYLPCTVPHNFPTIGTITMLYCYLSIYNDDMCLYKDLGGGNFVIGLQVWEPYKFSDFDAKVVRYFYQTQVNKMNCCPLSSQACAPYLSRRELNNSLNAKRKRSEHSSPVAAAKAASPPQYLMGFGYGTMHLVTPDNSFLTFNGLGEFTLLQDPTTSFEIQIRTTAISSGAATSISALALSDGIGGIVSAYVDPYGLFKVLLDGFYDPISLEVGGEPFTLQPGGLSIRLVSEASLVLTAPNGVLLFADVTLQTISFRVLLPATLKGHLRGLLGVFDGNPENDFTFRNGQEVLPPSATTEELQAFGLSWMVTEATSLFSYPEGQGFADLNDPAFVPAYPETMPYDPELTLTAQDSCTAAGPVPFSSACVFDVLAARSISAATLSVAGGRTVQDYLAGLNQPPTFQELPAVQPAKIGETVVMQLSLAHSLGTSASVLITSTPVPEGVLDATALTYTFTWTEAHFLTPNPAALIFTAIDNHNVAGKGTVQVTNDYASCDAFDQVVVEANLELSSFCPVDADTCSEDCNRVMARLVTLDCYNQLARTIGEPLSGPREVCCEDGNNPSVPCAGLNPLGIGMVVLACILAVAIIAVVGIYVARKIKVRQSENDEASSPLVTEKDPRPSYGN